MEDKLHRVLVIESGLLTTVPRSLVTDLVPLLPPQEPPLSLSTRGPF